MKFLIDIVIFAVIFVICIPVGYIVAGFFEDLFTPKDVKEARRKAYEEFKREWERKERFPHEYEDKRKERFAKYNPCELYFPTVQDWEAQKEYIDDYDEYIQKWAFEYYKNANVLYLRCSNCFDRDVEPMIREVDLILNTSDIIGYDIISKAPQMEYVGDTSVVEPNTGSAIGRAVVGGLIGGGVGAAIGAATTTRNIVTTPLYAEHYYDDVIMISTKLPSHPRIHISPYPVAKGMRQRLCDALDDIVASTMMRESIQQAFKEQKEGKARPVEELFIEL